LFKVYFFCNFFFLIFFFYWGGKSFPKTAKLFLIFFDFVITSQEKHSIYRLLVKGFFCEITKEDQEENSNQLEQLIELHFVPSILHLKKTSKTRKD